jgi:hypothetical protein
VAYTFVAPTADRYLFTLTPTGWDGAVYVLDSCPAAVPLPACAGGADHGGSSAVETTIVSMQAGQTYIVVVDGWTTGSKGAYTLTAAVAPPAPAGDVCATAPALVAGTPATVDTTSASNDVTIASGATGCASSSGSGKDVVYTFHAATTDRYLFTLTPPTGASPVLSVVPTCVDGALAACLGSDAPGTDGVAHVIVNLTAGTDYTVVVDSTSASGSGVYTLTGGVAPPAPAGDVCATAPALVAGTPVTVDTTLASNDVTIASTATQCSPSASNGRDVVYRFQAPATGPYLVTLVPPANVSPVLSVVASCVDGPLTACLGSDEPGTGSTAHVLVQATAGTTYTVVVDATSSSAVGVFTLSAELLPDIDVCSSSVPALTVGTTVTGDTTFYSNDYSTSSASTHCTGYGSDGPDVVYQFTAPAAGRYQFTLTPDASSTADVTLYVLDACPATSAVASCLSGADHGSSGEPEVAVATLAQGQTVYVVADGYTGGEAGPYSLDVAALPPGPQGDVCGTAFPLASHDAAAAPETLTGSLLNATDDVAGSCSSSSGNDVVYALTLTEEVAFTATLTAADGGTYPGILHLNSDCAAATANELSCVTTSQGALTVPHLGNATGGTYWLWVDGTSATAADYVLTVALGAAQPAPSGDVCSSALTLTESTTVSGTLASFSNDLVPVDSSCHQSSPNGPDVVYSFVPQTTGLYEFTLTPTSTMHASVYLLDHCPTGAVGTCLGGADHAFSTSTASKFRATVTQGQTYYVVADSHAGDTGTYTLTAALVIIPPGDSCAVITTGGNTSALVLAALPAGGQGASLSVDLSDASLGDDSQSSSAGACGGSGYCNDRVFELTFPTAVASATLTFAPASGSGLNPILYVRAGPTCSDSASSATELACNHPSSGDATVTLGNQAAGSTVYVWADCYGGASGVGTLSVTTP